MHRPAHAAALAAGLAAAALLLAACGSETGGPGGGSGGGSSAPPRIVTLDEARAAWAGTGASTGEYTLQVVRSCFCAPVMLTSTVRGGKAVEVSGTSPAELGGTGGEADDQLLVGIPRTVAELHDALAKAQTDAHLVAVTYDSQGVPVSVWVDPIENAVDDEYGYDVVFSSRDVDASPADDDGSWRTAPLPSGTSFPTDMPWRGSAQAVLATSGGTTSLHLGLWGSSSCPQVPRTLTWLPSGSGEGPGTVQAVVRVDATQPPDTACTEDYGPTTYVAAVPADVLAGLPSATGPVSVLLETVSGTAADPVVTSSVVTAVAGP